jgi:drug/metabolite transporter (DMT)-like permease
MLIKNNYYKGIIYVALAAALWSFVAIALKIAVKECPPATINWLRFIIAFMGMVLYFLFKDRQKFSVLKHPPLIIVFAAIGLAVNYLGYIFGVHYTSPSTTQVIIQFAPAMFALSGFFIFKEKIKLQQIAGFVVAIVGLSFFYKKQVSHMLIDTDTFNLGIIWIFISAFGWTIYAILQKMATKNYPVLQMNLIIYGLPSLLFLPFVNFQILSTLSFFTWGMILFLGLNTLFSYNLLAEGLKHIEANKSSVIITLNPILTFITMAILERTTTNWIAPEHFDTIAIVGAVLVLVGCIIVVGFKSFPHHPKNL